MTLRLPGRGPLPWQRRGLLVLAAATVVALAAGMIVGAQVRAAQAEGRRDALAAAQAEQERAVQERTERLAALARARLAAFERGDRVAAWTVAALAAQAALADADTAWAESSGAVADEAVRQSLAEAAARLRDLLAQAPAEPDPATTTALTEATAAVTAAAGAVAQSRAERQAAEEAAAAQAAAAAQRARSGAGADCGGPGSYQPPSGSGATLHTSVPAEEGDGSNGRIPRSAMAPLAWCVDALGNQQWLRADAADALTRLNAAFRERFGENIAVDLSYRSYDDQVRARELFGSLAARPGTSNHGWGTAIDTWEWAAYDFGSERYTWLVENGPAYGWFNPAASEPGNPEYWHYEYRG